MQGNYIKVGNNKLLITQPELWTACTSEEEYFRTLRESQTLAQISILERKRKVLISGSLVLQDPTEKNITD